MAVLCDYHLYLPSKAPLAGSVDWNRTDATVRSPSRYRAAAGVRTCGGGRALEKCEEKPSGGLRKSLIDSGDSNCSGLLGSLAESLESLCRWSLAHRVAA